MELVAELALAAVSDSAASSFVDSNGEASNASAISSGVSLVARTSRLFNNVELPLFHVQHSQQFVFER